MVCCALEGVDEAFSLSIEKEKAYRTIQKKINNKHKHSSMPCFCLYYLLIPFTSLFMFILTVNFPIWQI